MKALIINGSPHASGCTATALGLAAAELQKAGIETDMVHVGHMDIHGCIGCYRCAELGRCVFDNDIVNRLAPRFAEADALLVGSPVYYAGPSGTLLSLLDRLFFSTQFPKRMKVGAAVVSARRSGTTAALDRLTKYFTISEMPVASSFYWPMVHGNSPDEVLRDEEGCQIMRQLGRNMAFLVKAVVRMREAEGLPQQEDRCYTNFIR